MEYLFMFFGLGFLLYVIWMIERADEKRYDRKMKEWREFGYEGPKRRFPEFNDR